MTISLGILLCSFPFIALASRGKMGTAIGLEQFTFE